MTSAHIDHVDNMNTSSACMQLYFEQNAFHVQHCLHYKDQLK